MAPNLLTEQRSDKAMILVRRIATPVLGLALFAAGLCAQDRPTLHDKTSSAPAQPTDAPALPTPDKPTIQVNVKEVSLPVIVRDKKGKIVENLTKDDFVLEQDRKAQAITNFRKDTNLPLTLGLLVDTSMSMREQLSTEKSASQKFFDEMMTQPKDQAFVLHFDRQVELLQDLTSSRDKLYNALGLLETSHSSQDTRDDRDDHGDGPSMRRRGGTQLYDAVYLASTEVLKNQAGRKALIVLSDGQDRGSKESFADAVEAAQRAETVVYAIYLKGDEEHRGFGNDRGNGQPRIGFPGGGGGYPPGYPGGGNPGGQRRRGGEDRNINVNGKKVMTDLAAKTGGRMFEVTKKDSMDSIYAQISEEMRNQFLLAYTPDKASAESGYHRVALTTKNKDLKVQTREGYYIPEPTAEAEK